MYQQYDKAVQTIRDYLVDEGFSISPRKAFHHATRELKAYLERGSVLYSYSAAEAWLTSVQPSVPRWKFLSFRRALALVDFVLRHGAAARVKFSFRTTPVRERAPECFRHLLEQYIAWRKREGKQVSTLQMDDRACTRFLLFVDSQSGSDLASITPSIIKAYHTQAKHETVEGKNAYTYRIRGFVRYLATRNLVPSTLELAFSTEKASRLSIVTTLSPKQIDQIRIFKTESSSPSQLRSVAMTLLALRMGLRSIDICNLRLADISWGLSTISIIQQKTGVPLTLPFPVEVGNTLSRYILEGRPPCDLPQVFVTLRHPLTRLTSSACYRSTIRILGKKGSATDIRGLHIARRTFASNLLVAQNPVSVIAAALGHVDESKVDDYLATDEYRLRQCAIGLAGIEPVGALL